MHIIRIRIFTQEKMNGYGYILNLDGEKYFIAGDTDNIDEIQNIKCDVALLPIGGTYTMNCEEAASLANVIEAKIVIPTHYGLVMGTGGKKEGEKFAKLVKDKEVQVFIK